ncbi:hypothetical protein DQ04_01511010 [Trypanosoma grayi]|uniref:hypothetical protein n=1 Tax=Trypanosoma grayi TaxID=71804 RepID=UPI0004F42964|nr:hypothetical protein DQ04_01511010 [Trypanosoma grayi]KEG12682.1 hypothetical protein DQ04_01511010 [Trypanosoma grayi]
MRFASDGGYVPDGDTQQALQLADRLTEEEWRCVVEFGRPRRVRQALVWLLRVTFNSSARSAAVWLTRCLSSCAGFLLEALCDVVMSVTDNEVRVCSRSAESAKKQHRQNTEQQEEEGAPLLQLCAALGNVLRRLGHVPQWPSLLQRAVHWLLLTHAEEKVASAVRPSLLQRRLMQLVMEFLACEEGVYSLLRRTLLQPGEVQQDQQEEQQQQVRRAGRKSGRDKDDVNDAFVQAIGVPFIPSVAMLHAAQSGVSINDDEEEEEEEERGGDSEAAARRTVAVCTLLARRIFSKEFALLLVRYCGTDEAAKAAATKTTEACAASVLWQLYSIALTVCRNERATHDSPSTAHIFVLAVVDAMRRSCKRGDYAAVSTFLSVANGGHVVFAGAARKPASIEATLKRQRHEKKKGEGEEEEEPSSAAAVTAEANTNNDRSDERGTAGEEARIHEVATRWMDLLAALFLQVVQSLATGVDAPLLRAFTALYMSLEKVRGSTTMLLPAQSGEEFATRDNRKRPQQHGRREEGLVSLALAAIAAPRPPSAAGPGLRELFDPSDHEARRRSLATLVRLLTSTEESAMQILWVLFVVHEERRLFASGGDRDTSSGSGWLSLLLSSFDPRQKYTTSDEAMQQLLDTVERGAAATTEEAQRNSRMFTLATLQRGEAACCTDAVTQWLLLQLRVMPSILRAFPTDAAPALLQQYMHALLHEAVKFSVPSSASGLSPCCWGRHEQLLTTASTALQQLSAVPYMRFSVWRGDVKRLLVASGASPLLASGAAAPLWCRVLELCALPLPALHDDCAFVDHELYFLHRLLNGTGVTARRDDAAQRGESEEKLLLCILRLLARTLLPLGVLWRRPHLLPALLSSVLVRCLDGVARGRCGRVVLNQLSSFFYQFVKDATSSDKGSSSSSSSSAAHASSSVKALCLASVTTCLFRLSASYVDVFTTHSSDLDFLAADFLKALQRLHLPRRRTPSILQQKQGSSSNNNWSDATLCDLSYACVGNDDSQSLLRQAAERVEEDEGNGERRIFMVPS